MVTEYDSALEVYLSEIRRYPVLSMERQIELARAYHETGDVRYKHELVVSNLRLVVRIAREYYKKQKGIALLDIIQAGNIGLVRALDKFDPDRRIAFISYAQWWIRAEIGVFLLTMRYFCSINSSRAGRKLFYQIGSAARLLEEKGLPATDEMIATVLEIDVTYVKHFKSISSRIASFDEPIRGTDTKPVTLRELIPDTKDGPQTIEDVVYASKLRRAIDTFGTTITDRRERYIWEKRISVMDHEPETLKEIGIRFGVTRERIRQIEVGIKDRLRSYIDHELPDHSF